MMWDFDFIDEFKHNWNEKIKIWKTIYIVLSTLMILAGIVCLFFPSQIYDIIKIIAGIVMIGIWNIFSYQLSYEYQFF